MKVCTVTHTVAGFGEVPSGSLWDDDSPFVVEFDKFADITNFDDPPPVKRPPVRKFKPTTITPEGDDAA